MHVADAIKSGQINLEHSYKYRSLDEYLIAKNRWDAEKKDLLHRAELEDFAYCKPVLKQLEHALSMQYKNTNDHIQNNDNSYFKVRTNDNFTIATPKQEDEATDLLKTYVPHVMVVVAAHTESNGWGGCRSLKTGTRTGRRPRPNSTHRRRPRRARYLESSYG